MFQEKLINIRTGEVYPSSAPYFVSPEGDLLDFEMDVRFDPSAIAGRKPDLWRYREALPSIADSDIVSVNEGFTPLLWLQFGKIGVWVKQEHVFASGSYKDRGATVLMSKVKSLGLKEIVQDSSGNAGASIAAYAAMAGIACEIFVPSSTSEAKIRQIRAYGAKLTRVEGSREDTANAAKIASSSRYYASHCINPFFFQGTKTLAFEICEQLGWQAPESIIVPVGNGTLVMGAYLGFRDLLKAGIIRQLPRIIAVQATHCAPLYAGFMGIEVAPIQPTQAEGIAIANPVRSKQILNAIRETHGLVLTVDESEITQSQQLCGQMGFYIEPTSAATIAGVLKFADGYSTENTVTLFTGHGLKK